MGGGFRFDELAGRPMSRRDVLRAAGKGGLGMAAAAFLAACGGSSGSSTPSAETSASGLPALTHELVIAQWPLYIDQNKDGVSPTLEQFKQTTGIDLQYKEIIQDNAAFFAKLFPQMKAGEWPGYDLITLSDWVVVKMVREGWLETFDMSAMPNVQAQLGQAFKNPPYDPGNAHSIPWQGGITGIAYDPKLAPFEPTKFADLWDERLKGHVGMLTEMVDTMNLTLLMLGVDIQQATLDDAKKAQEKLIEQRDAGIVRQYYGQNYVQAISSGDTWATMAWSGDIFQLQLDNPDLKFIVPEEGGILWVTPMELLVGSQHPADAHAFLDFVYRPDIGAQIAEWVAYITPVAGARAVIEKHAKQATSSGDRTYLETLLNSPLVFPTEEMLANLHSYKVLSADEESAWNDLFNAVTTA